MKFLYKENHRPVVMMSAFYAEMPAVDHLLPAFPQSSKHRLFLVGQTILAERKHRFPGGSGDLADHGK